MPAVLLLSSRWFTAESEHHACPCEGCKGQTRYLTRKSIKAWKTAEHFTSTFPSQSPESWAKSSNWLIIGSRSLIASSRTCLKSFIQSSQSVRAWLKPRHVIAKLQCANCGEKTPLGVKMVLISFSLLVFCYYFSTPGICVNCNLKGSPGFAWEVPRKYFNRRRLKKCKLNVGSCSHVQSGP